MQAQPFPQPQPPAGKPGPSLVLSLVLMFIGVVIAVPCAIKGIAPIVRGVTKTPVLTPVDTQMHFSHGTYLIYDRTDAFLGGAIAPSDVTVTADDGTTLPIGFPTDEEHITRNGATYQGVVRFDVDTAGRYHVQVTATGHEVIITRSLVDTVKHSVGWFAAAGLGGMVFVLGVVLLIVGSVRRGRAQRAAYAYPGGYAQPYSAPYAPTTPPGWYPDTTTPGQQRWWDGSQWTEHTHPSS